MTTESLKISHYLGIFGLWLSIMSYSLSDWLMPVFGGKAYLYYIGFPLSILAWLACGTTFRACRTTAGKLWILLGVWMFFCVPTSVWPGGSVELLKTYALRVHPMFFMICAFALAMKQCRTLMYANVTGGLIMLLSCFVFGGTQQETGRFCLPNSLYFANPNDLALQLVVFIGFFTFLLLDKTLVLRVLGGVAILLTLWFLLRTGSRGAFVACVVLFIMAFIFTKAKLKMSLVLLGVALLIPTISKDALQRLTTIFSEPDVTTADEKGVGSKLERQHLFWLSVHITLTHPIFGVGPGMFIEATSGVDQKHGIHSPALGTHNSYTEISSECGIPGLICFLGVVIISVRKMLKLYRETVNVPELRDISTLAYSLFLSCLGFGVAAFFYHVTYTGYVPLLGGMAMAVWLASEPVLRQREQLQPVTPEFPTATLNNSAMRYGASQMPVSR